MTRAGDLFENAVTRERVLVRVGGEDTSGRYLAVDTWVGPHAIANEHVHPHVRERVTVLEGWVRVRVDGVERDARPGEVVDVPPGTVHDYWNPGDEEAHVLVEVWPAARFEEMMVTLFGLAQEGRVSARGLPSLLQLAVLAHEFDDVVLFSSPPRWVQRAVIAVLAPVARLCGVRATYAHHGPLMRRHAQDAEHATRRAA